MPWTGGAVGVDQVADSDVSKYILYRDAVELVQVDPPGGAGQVVFSNLSVQNDGTYRYSVATKDLAGNVSARSGDLVVVLDHIAPAIPGAPTLIQSFSWSE